jgi:hypothetical protein
VKSVDFTFSFFQNGKYSHSSHSLNGTMVRTPPRTPANQKNGNGYHSNPVKQIAKKT